MKSPFWKRFCTITITFLGLVTYIVTIVNGLPGAINEIAKILGPIISPFFVYFNLVFSLPFAIFLLVMAIISSGTYSYRKSIGTHRIPCSLIGIFHFKVANKNCKLLKTIHGDIYHYYYKIKDDLHRRRINSIDEVNKRFEEFLFIIHASILRSLNLNLTINVKRLIIDRQNKLYLVPFIHYRNSAEREMETQRDFNYSYYIDRRRYVRLPRYVEMAKRYYKDYGAERKYEVNSIFTYLVAQSKSHWMSNNLEEDVEAGDFYTSSDNYPDFYRSMAAFSIIPPNNRKETPKGLIIFDTKKTGRFSERECVNLFGYIAHLFYELLIEYDDYVSAQKRI